MMAAAAVAYTAFILFHARPDGSDRSETGAASPQLSAESARVPSTPMQPAAAPPREPADPKRPLRTRVLGSEDQVVEVGAGDPVESVKATEAPASKPKRARPTGKLRKAQGALRNLDF